jgi:hypothetical protein
MARPMPRLPPATRTRRPENSLDEAMIGSPVDQLNAWMPLLTQ